MHWADGLVIRASRASLPRAPEMTGKGEKLPDTQLGSPSLHVTFCLLIGIKQYPLKKHESCFSKGKTAVPPSHTCPPASGPGGPQGAT